MKLIAELFEPLVGQNIVVHLDDGTQHPLTLTKVSPTGSPSPQDDDGTPGGHRAFSLDLKGPPDTVLAPLTYPVTAQGVPSDTFLFVSAHSQDDDGTYYYVIVN